MINDENAHNLTTCVLSFAYLIFILNLIQWPAPRCGLFQATCWAMNRWCATFVEPVRPAAEKSAKIKVFTGDRVPCGENAILVCNHQSMT